MKSLYKINNNLLFIISSIIPFLSTWKYNNLAIGNLNQIAILLIFYFAFARRIQNNYNVASKKAIGLTGFYFIFLILSFGSSLFCADVHPTIEQIILNIQFFLILLILSRFCYYKEAISGIYNGLCLGFFIAILIGFMQFLGVSGFDIFKQDQLNTNTSYVSQDQLIDVVRIWGPFGNALSFSLYLSVTGIVIFYYLKFYKKKILFAWVVFAITLFSIGLTVSRMGFVAFLSTFFLIEIFLANKRRRIIYYLLTIFLIILIPIILNSLTDSYPFISRLTESEDDFKSGRWELWVAGFSVLKDNIFWGVGPGNLSYNLNTHGWSMPSEYMNILSAQHVENYYLTLLFTYGIIPFFFYILFVIRYFKSSFDLFKTAVKKGYGKETMPILGGLICFFINNLINPILISDIKIQMLFLVLLAIIVSYTKKPNNENIPSLH